ncbi:hypothetical protein GALMADRAFT_138620 [Galerina marginata CBS 339.88]|uniref:Uncharacterized protein n=1 Tax=Galerina marginata (strain CBS 339.88) TaxID=685588 RepID=A0A067TCB7_GALM3|nr:hypothetical protein GALMADRAFT_138620 [Galerina marginata CBS 339.88]
MSHKKAKRSVREKLRNEQGSDLAPGKESLRNETIPKSAARVFNSQTIREEWKLKKRKAVDGDSGSGPAKRQKHELGTSNGQAKKAEKKVVLTIQPGESMQHFNRRVEDDLRPLVKSAVQTSRAVARNVVKSEREARLEAKKVKQFQGKPNVVEEVEKPRPNSPSPQEVKFAGHPKEFQSTLSSAPKRLNDVAQAPPELKKLPRGSSIAIGKRDGVLSMSQKVMMEQERDKAIARYRELKASRRQLGDMGDKLEYES